jgi:hypothetical protein
LLFGIENGETVNIEIEFSQIGEIEGLLEGVKEEDLSPDMRVSKIRIMKFRKSLLDQQKLLIRALDIALRDPILSFLQMKSSRLALVLRGLGTLLFEESMVAHGTVLLDVWQKDNRRISTIVRTFPESEKENDHYHRLIGEGWDLYDIYEKPRYERAIPAIIFEYIKLLDEGELENPERLLDLYSWYVGLR